MADEVIDLTNSPPSFPPPSPPARSSSNISRVLKFPASNSSKKTQFKLKQSSPSSRTQNHGLSYINQKEALTILRDLSKQGYDFSQIVSNLQAQHAVVYEPDVAASKAFLFPQGTKLRQSWTLKEHELFLMGLVEYGRGSWTKIARQFLWNRTPPQIQSYATSFFRHLPATCLYSYRKKNSSLVTFITSNDRMPTSGFTLDLKPMMMAKENMPTPPPTLMLFPDRGECSNSTSVGASKEMETSTYGGGGAVLNMTGNGGEVDLELRLGRNFKLTSYESRDPACMDK